MAKGKSFVIMDEAVLERIAHIIGPQSAAARALAEVERQRALGNDYVVGNTGQSFVVCGRAFAEMRCENGR